jgi:hypothetical protein
MLLTESLYAFNHPEIKWRSVVSDHFIINYYNKTEPAIYATWKIAEQEYGALTDLYDFTPGDKINISLADYDDYSNGSAGWTNGSIVIWITDSRFDLRGNNTWLRNVITHELSHIITLEKQSKMQLLDWTFNLGYSSPHSDIALTVPVPTSMFWPEWFAEGIAQRESERAGNDSRDAMREMLLRDAILVSKPLTLEEMGHFNHNTSGNELVYNQGFSLVKFIENKFGREQISRMFNDGRQTTFFPHSFATFFQEHTGYSIDDIYREWLAAETNEAQKRLTRVPSDVNLVWDRGLFNMQPKTTDDGNTIGWLSSDRDDYDRTDLLVAQKNSIYNTLRIPWAKQAWTFSPDGKQIYYVKSHTPNDNGSYINDIFVTDLKTHREKRIVKNARAYDIAVSPDNRNIVWIKYGNGSFSIAKCSVNGSDQTTVVRGILGEPFWYLSFNPANPAEIATTKLVNGKPRLCIVNIEDGTISDITGSASSETSPFWAKDGRIYYSADYDSIYTIYSTDPYQDDCRRHAVTQGGLFSPWLSDSGTIVCSEYKNRGYRIVSIDADNYDDYAIPDSSGASFKPDPAPRGKVSIHSVPYQPRLLRSVMELTTDVSITDQYGKLENMQDSRAFRKFADSMSYIVSTEIYMSKTDALEKRGKWMALLAELVIEGDTETTKSNSSHFALYDNPLGKKSPSLNLSGKYRHGLDSKDILSSFNMYENYNKGQNSWHSSTDSGSSSSNISALLVPGLGWTNSEYAVSLGLNLQAMLVSAILPAVIYATGNATWQINRDLYFLFYPEFELYTYTLLSSSIISVTALPFTLEFSSTGYINTDISYNLSDVTLIAGTIMPGFFPIGNTVYTSSGEDSTVYHTGSSITYDLQIKRGFPLTRYSSIVLGAEATLSDYSENISDPGDTLYGSSDIYTKTDFSAQLNFPIARQINRGALYMDALYGILTYNASLYTNRDISDRAFSTALWQPHYKQGIYCVEHSIGAGIRLGCTKSYTFSNINSIMASWDVWAKKMKISLSFFL